MSKSSAISITWKLEGDAQSFKKLIQDADGLKKALASAAVEADKLRNRWITFANFGNTVTVAVERVDSVAVPYPEETPLTRWQQVKQDVGGAAIGVALSALLAGAAWLALRLRRLRG